MCSISTYDIMGKYDHLTREELIVRLEQAEQNETVKLRDRLDGERRIAQALVLMLQNNNNHYEEDILRIVLERYQADRAFLFQFNWEEGNNSNIYEVYSEGISPEIHNLQGLPNEALGDYLAQFRQGLPLIVNDVEQMPETTYQGHLCMKQVFRNLHLKSAILFPMHIFGELWGYVGMETVRQYRNWDEDDIEWLKAFTDILSIGVSQRFFRTQASDNERRFSELFKNMPIGYVRHRMICDENNQAIDYEYLEVNPAFEQLTGKDKSQCIGKTTRQLTGNLNPDLIKIYQEVAFEGKQIQLDYYAPSFNKWFYSVLYSPAKGEFISLFYDITDRLKATEQIRKNEKKIRTLLENLPVSIVSFDNNGYFLECNELAARTFKRLTDPTQNSNLNLDAKQMEILNDNKIFSLDFAFNVEKQKLSVIQNNILPEGAIYLSSKTIKFTDENEEGQGYLFIAIDNTDIKKANLELTKTQKALTEHLVRQSLILETGQIYPWYMDVETGEVEMSEDFFKAFGENRKKYTSESSGNFLKYIHPDDVEVYKQEYQKLAKGQTQRIKLEVRLNLFKRGYIWCEINAAVRNPGKSGRVTKWLGFLTIIQQRKDNEQQLIEAMKKAKESDKLKSAFLANVSHEIRTPLNAIVGFSELIATTEDEEEKQVYLDIVKTNNNLLLNLINDILDLSKIESGRMDLKETIVDIRELCQELCHVHQLRAQAGVKVIFDDPGQPLLLLTDRNRLTQLYSNLINNAIKNTSEGSITIGFHQKRQNIECYVRDTGKGIPKEKQDIIFNRFEKLDTNVQGFGLGLSICRSILEKMNGSISLTSREGKGSVFRFTLPYRAPRQKQIKPLPTPAITPRTCVSKELTILIAEDVDANFELLRAILEKNYRLVRARTGIEAINLYTKEAPALILMDMQMPELSGIEATQIIREVSPDIPIIALTAFAYDSDKEAAMEAGCNDFMIKPVDIEKLHSMIQKYIVS